MTEPKDYQQARCKHGWVIENNQCPDCKEIDQLKQRVADLESALHKIIDNKNELAAYEKR